MKRFFILFMTALLLFSCGPSEDEIISKKILGLKKMAELGTVEYTIKKIIKADDALWYTYGERKILFSCTAYLKAGIDMADFDPNKVVIDKEKKAITVTLPDAKLLSFSMPVDQIQQEFCAVTGFRKQFSIKERQDLKIQGEQSILEDVPNYGILDDARNNARDFFEATFALLGYDDVTVMFENCNSNE